MFFIRCDWENTFQLLLNQELRSTFFFNWFWFFVCVSLCSNASIFIRKLFIIWNTKGMALFLFEEWKQLHKFLLLFSIDPSSVFSFFLICSRFIVLAMGEFLFSFLFIRVKKLWHKCFQNEQTNQWINTFIRNKICRERVKIIFPGNLNTLRWKTTNCTVIIRYSIIKKINFALTLNHRRVRCGNCSGLTFWEF